MKSYDCTICVQFFRYIIHDNGVLEYLELSGTGETKKSESCPLSAYNPIPEKKKKDSPYAGFLLFLFFLALTLNLVNLVLIYFFHAGYAKSMILTVFPFVFLIPLVLRKITYCFPSFTDIRLPLRSVIAKTGNPRNSCGNSGAPSQSISGRRKQIMKTERLFLKQSEKCATTNSSQTVKSM